MRPSSRRFLAPLLLSLSFGNARAITYDWLAANSTGGTGNGWQLNANVANFPAATPGNFAYTAADELLINAVRTVNANTSATIGKITYGGNLTAGVNVSWSNSAVVNLAGGSEAGAGIEVRAPTAPAADSSRFSAPLVLSGAVTFANFSERLFNIGNTAGNGGLQGSGTLDVIGGRFVFRSTTVAYNYSGAISVRDGGILQIPSDLNFSTPSGISIGAGGTLAGRGSVPTTTIGAGGTFNPGNEFDTNWGTFNVTGDLRLQTGSLLNLGVTSAAWDNIAVTGGILQQAGELRLTLSSGLVNPGIYQLLTGTKDGTFDTVSLWDGTTSKGNFTTTTTDQWQKSDGDLTYHFDSGLGQLTLVPEPGVALLSTLGLLALALRRKRTTAAMS